jgi:uncharacterized membrane-anchored protein
LRSHLNLLLFKINHSGRADVHSKIIATFALFVVVPITTAQVTAQPANAPDAVKAEQQFNALPWLLSPAKPNVTERAVIALTPEVRYLDAKGTNSFLQLTGNLPETDSYTIAAKDNGWFAVYTFADIGYVKDDETIDADALMKQMKEGDEEQNEARREQGLEPLTTAGWAVPPHYDKATKNLEYGVTLSTATGQNINYHMRILGRKGVMDAALVTSADTLQADLAEFRAVNKNFAFNSDESYASYKDGDKVSEYGLAALVTGGAAAAALKGGLFKGLLILLAKFWKLIALAVVGGFAAFRKFFGGKSDENFEGGSEP